MSFGEMLDSPHPATYVGHMELIPTSEAAAQLGVTKRTLNRMAVAGKITPASKAPGVRGAYLYEPAEVARVLNEHREEAS